MLPEMLEAKVGAYRILWYCGADSAEYTCTVQQFCLQGKLLSFQKWYKEREADLVSCSTARSLSRSFCWRGPRHIQLSKPMRQQSQLVMRALGRDWFLTSSPEVFPASHEAEMWGDALLCSSEWMAHSSVKGPFKGTVQAQWADFSQDVVN